ncbi:MAG TPA: fluoride efflux transporter CrcB [Bacteroidota bacterium]|jgi:CrcB protein|nr:fluoride efflux transporter CrcB [Bacteroidota bacterium]
MFKILLIIGSGSFFGGILRYLISYYLQEKFLTSFPLGTLTVNIIGCFLIGVIFGLSDSRNLFTYEMRIFLSIGFCGGFTTFSTFSNETIALLRDGDFFYAITYISISLFICLLSTYLGITITKIN